MDIDVDNYCCQSGVTYKYCISSTEEYCNTYVSNRFKTFNVSEPNWTSTIKETGKYIYVTACDGAGNCTSKPNRGNLFVDSTKPTITVTGGSTTWGGSKQFSFKYNDSVAYNVANGKYTDTTQSGNGTIEYKIDSGDWSSTTVANNTSLTIYKAGTKIKFRACDKVSNCKESDTLNLYVQRSFTFSVSGGSTTWANTASRTFTISNSTCKGTTTYSYKDADGNWISAGNNISSLTYKIADKKKLQIGTIKAICYGDENIKAEKTVDVYINRQYYTLTISDLNGEGSYTVQSNQNVAWSPKGKRIGSWHVSSGWGELHKWYQYSGITEEGSGGTTTINGQNYAYVSRGNYKITGNYNGRGGQYHSDSGDMYWYFHYNGTDCSLDNCLSRHNKSGFNNRKAIWTVGNNRSACNCYGSCDSYKGTEDQNLCLLTLYKTQWLVFLW